MTPDPPSTPELPSLPARQAGWVRRLLAEDGFLADLAHGIGGPFHLLFPDQFTANVVNADHDTYSPGVCVVRPGIVQVLCPLS